MKDNFAISSYKRAQAATQSKYFESEIIPITVPGARGKPGTVIDKDDEVLNVIPIY
jgi:acetyl-CoA C-acetyltransferase